MSSFSLKYNSLACPYTCYSLKDAEDAFTRYSVGGAIFSRSDINYRYHTEHGPPISGQRALKADARAARPLRTRTEPQPQRPRSTNLLLQGHRQQQSLA